MKRVKQEESEKKERNMIECVHKLLREDCFEMDAVINLVIVTCIRRMKEELERVKKVLGLDTYQENK